MEINHKALRQLLDAKQYVQFLIDYRVAMGRDMPDSIPAACFTLWVEDNERKGK